MSFFLYKCSTTTNKVNSLSLFLSFLISAFLVFSRSSNPNIPLSYSQHIITFHIYKYRKAGNIQNFVHHLLTYSFILLFLHKHLLQQVFFNSFHAANIAFCFSITSSNTERQSAIFCGSSTACSK